MVEWDIYTLCTFTFTFVFLEGCLGFVVVGEGGSERREGRERRERWERSVRREG